LGTIPDQGEVGWPEERCEAALDEIQRIAVLGA